MWNDLSMREKAAMIKVAVNNGIYDLNDIRNKFDDGGFILPEVVVTPEESYTNFTGEETVPISRNFFLEEKRNRVRENAVRNILKQEQPLVPILPSRRPISWLLGKLGASDEYRLKHFGIKTSFNLIIYTKVL